MDRRIFRGRLFDVVQRRILKRGRRVRLDMILHPGAVVVVPILPGGRVAMIRQWRGTVGETLYEVVAGTLEPGESPAAAARRELVEEVGLAAGRLRKLAEFYSAPGFCTELLRLFLATDLREVGARPERDEFLRRVDMPLGRALAMARAGKIRDAKTIVGLTLAAHACAR
jgi:ADP-ribose pyrophosphatase